VGIGWAGRFFALSFRLTFLVIFSSGAKRNYTTVFLDIDNFQNQCGAWRDRTGTAAGGR